MTATAHLYTVDGFAIAVDGRQRWGNEPSRSESISRLESENAQKLFEITNEQMSLAYTAKGHIANRERSFDLIVELKQQIELARTRPFRSSRSFVELLAVRMERIIKDALEQGRLECHLSSEICFVGYFDRSPCWLDLHFKPPSYPFVSIWNVLEQDVRPGLCVVSGSEAVKDLVEDHHPEANEFNVRLDEYTSLKSATEFVTGYIRLCCSEWALKIDPGCISIGGHVHAAVVTPPSTLIEKTLKLFGFETRREAGFRWTIPPL